MRKRRASKARNKIKIVVLGNSCVGKSCIVKRYVSKTFTPSSVNTIGIDVQKTQITLDGEAFGLHIWDTAGQERFKSITVNYIRGADGVLLVYDITDRESFDQILSWAEHFNHLGPNDIASIIVGNKRDLTEIDATKRKVTTEEGGRVAESLNARFIEVSAKSGDNVDEIFDILTKDIRIRGIVHGHGVNLGQEKRSSVSKMKGCCGNA